MVCEVVCERCVCEACLCEREVCVCGVCEYEKWLAGG